MKRLTPKIADFTGTSVFIRNNGTHEVSDSASLPEGFIFGLELPTEEGVYFSSSSLGSFVLRISDSGISVLWSSRTGSFNDGAFIYNNSIAYPDSINDEIVFQEANSRLDAWYESFVDFGDFYILGPFDRSNTGTVLDIGFIKVDKDFQVLERFYHTGYDVDVYGFEASQHLDGLVYYEYTTGELVHLNVHTGDITVTPVVGAGDHYHLAGIGEGRVAVFPYNDPEVLIYEYSGAGDFSFVASKVWTTEANDSFVGWGYNPAYNIKVTSDTIYIHDMRTGPTRRKIRAIDRDTLDLRWNNDDTGTAVGGAGGSYVEEFCAVLPNGNIVGARCYDRDNGLLTVIEEFDKDTGAVDRNWPMGVRGDFSAPCVWQTDADGWAYVTDYDSLVRVNMDTGDMEIIFGDWFGELEISPGIRTPLYKTSDGTYFIVDYWDRVAVYNSATSQKNTFDLSVVTQWEDGVLLFPVDGSVVYCQYANTAQVTLRKIDMVV